MPIFRAIGLGIFFIIVSLMMPKVFSAGQQTIISFLQGAQLSADTASRITATAAQSLPFSSSSLSSRTYLPQAPTIPSY